MESESWVSEAGKGRWWRKILGLAKIFAWLFPYYLTEKPEWTFQPTQCFQMVSFCLKLYRFCVSVRTAERKVRPGQLRHFVHTAQGRARTGNKTAGKGSALDWRSPVFLFLTITYFWQHGSLLRWAGAFSSCRIQVLGVQALVVVAHGLSCSEAWGIFPDQGSNPCPLHWQADS